MRNLVWILILLFLNSCGYTALYKNNENYNIDIEIVDMSGDEHMNRLVKFELENYFDIKSNDRFMLSINNNYQKDVSTKDTTGKPEEFRLSLITNLNIVKNEKQHNATFNESFKLKNSSDKFELNNYENIIKENFARSIKDKIILKLMSLK